MLFINQKGFAQLLLIIIILAGIGLGIYLVQNRTNIFSKAFITQAAQQTLNLQVNSSSDDVNQVNNTLTTTSSTVWLGTGGSATNSYTGFRFNSVSIPKNATIASAYLEFYSAQNQWINVGYDIYAENISTSPAFSTDNKPSQRVLTSNKIVHTSNTNWSANTWYQSSDITPVIQEVISRPDWQPGNSLSIILKGTVGAWGRKYIASFNGSSQFAPKLTIIYADNSSPSPTPTPAQGFTKGVAIIGDSHSDEYRADSNRGGTYGATTFNWMEVLANKRQINFGPWGSWGGARRNGYKYNWALSGMTTDGLISYNVGAGIAQQVTAGEVGYVLIQIGTDDFAPQLGTFFNDIYNGTISGATLESRLDTMAGRVSSTIDTIRAAGDVKIVLSTAIEADIPRVPLPDAEKQAYLTQYPDPVKRQRVLDAMIGYNQRLRSLAQTRSIPVFEGSEYFLTTVPSRFDANGFFNVGGELIDGKTRGDEPHHLLLGDTWFHPGTVASGQFANAMFIQMFNQHFQTNIAPLTDQEILQAAGIGSTPTPTPTPVPAPAPTPPPTGIVNAQVLGSLDDVNEVGGTLTLNSSSPWIGNGGTLNTSFSGFRFTNLNIPQGAVITSAKLEVYSSQSQWQSIAFNITADNSVNSPEFSLVSKPSQRGLTLTSVNHNSNVGWQADTWYQLDEIKTIIQEIVNNPGWQPGNSISIITKGTGSMWGRKFIRSFDYSPILAPKLIITYQ